MLKIHSAIVASDAAGVPGTILRSDAHGILVACADEGLLLGEIQPEARGRMHSSAFARGCALAVVS